MPMLDGTGPRGMGPKTGRGMGMCGCGGFNHLRLLTKKGRLEFLKETKDQLEENLVLVKEEISEIESGK